MSQNDVAKKVDYEKLTQIGRELLVAIGEDPDRAGIADTPRRWADWWRELVEYEPGKIDTVFESVSTDQMVVVSGMRVTSICVPGKQIVNAVDGAKPAREVKVGDKLWTLVNGETKETTVTNIDSHKTRNVFEIITTKGKFKVTGDHPLATPEGWIEAKDAFGRKIEWTNPRSLCRNRFDINLGYDFGYVLGAMFSDGTTGKNYISLVVNDEWFAQKFSDSLKKSFGVESKLEPTTRPSGFLKRQVAGFRVRVVSSYIADLFRQYAGGDAHHMRQNFPYVVLNNLETFQGFLDGYVDGDGYIHKKTGRSIISANIPFLQTLASLVGAKFTPNKNKPASQLYVSDHWYEKHGFKQEDHETTLKESEWADVIDVRDCSETQKPYTVYSFKCEPYPTFLVNGHLTHNCEHHLMPFWCDISIGYIAGEKVLGLSKFARVAHKYSHRPQLQEQLVTQIANELEELLGHNNIAVMATGIHSCMVFRGIKTEGTMTSSIMRGNFKDNPSARQEFLQILQMKARPF